MITTITFNPAIDYVVHTPQMFLGEVNRSLGEQMFFGGKGINVSVVLKELGIPSKALGFVAGFTGEAIENGLRDMGIDADFVKLPTGNSRINVKIKALEETELNGQGPGIDDNSLELLFNKLDALQSGDVLILAGSVPASLPPNVYEKILSRLNGRGVRAVVDASKDLLLNVLKYEPFLVKPNNIELGEMFGITLETDEQIELYARKLHELGAQNVLVSMAADGSMLIDNSGKMYRCGVCKGTVRNSVGAGDSMVAGFIAGLINSAASPDYGQALKLATACGGATAFSEGLAQKSLIDELLAQL